MQKRLQLQMNEKEIQKKLKQEELISMAMEISGKVEEAQKQKKVERDLDKEKKRKFMSMIDSQIENKIHDSPESQMKYKSKKVDNRSMEPTELLYNKSLIEEIKGKKRIEMQRNQISL